MSTTASRMVSRRRAALRVWLPLTLCLPLAAGCRSESAPPKMPGPSHRWEHVDGFPERLAVFETVFWDPRDTDSLRELIRTTPLVAGREVLEIGTGSGLVALTCLRAGAARVVATDINPQAIANARYNAHLLGVEDRLELRLVPLENPGAFSVIPTDERFDVIVSNPPWEDQRPRTIAEHALYDAQFALLESLLAGLREHLQPGGKALLAYGCVTAIRQVLARAPQFDLDVRILDPRPLEELPEVFLPGMLLEVTPREETRDDPDG